MESDIKKCPKCGTRVEAVESFCHNCGARIEQEPPPVSTPSSTGSRQGTEGSNTVTRQVQLQINFVPRRDWPLIGAAITAILCFFMLFPSWISGDFDANAFEEIETFRVAGLVGPVLIALMSLLGLLSIILALASSAPRYSNLALVLASNLLIIYLVEAGVIYAWSDAAEEGGEVSISVGAGVWLGLAFSFLMLALLVLAHALRRGLIGINIKRVDANNT